MPDKDETQLDESVADETSEDTTAVDEPVEAEEAPAADEGTAEEVVEGAPEEEGDSDDPEDVEAVEAEDAPAEGADSEEGEAAEASDDPEGENVEEKAMMAKPDKAKRRQQLLAELAALDDDEEDDEEDAPDGPDADTLRRRRSRLTNMGYKEEEIDELLANDNAFLCQVERKIMTGDEPCAHCHGGCLAEGKGLPSLFDIEAVAEEEYKGVVIESGYAPSDDMFILDIKTDKGDYIEALYRGDGSPRGWLMLDTDAVEEALSGQKSAAFLEERRVISMEEAEQTALKHFDGASLGVEVKIFNGWDAYAVSIDAGEKAYTAYVGIDNELLGYDEYDTVEPDDVKRAFSAEDREKMAKAGKALPDGSFPIENAEDLDNAIQAIGRAKNPDMARAHIMQRAVELGLEDKIPDEWLDDDEEGGEEKSLNDADTFRKSLAELEAIAADLD